MKNLKIVPFLLAAICFYLPAILLAQGANWTQATGSAQWQARCAHTSVIFDGKMWVIGGWYGMNDVWYSTDGVNWTQATPNAAWSARGYHTSVVFDNKMWVIGGSDFLRDVWYSADGVNWTQATASAAWSGRSGHTSVVFDNKMWVIGGNLGSDVWYSADGVSWTQATASAAWLGRSGHTSVVFDNKMWVIGGQDGVFSYTNDVWYSTDGANWTQATPSAGWSARYRHASVVLDGLMFVMGGSESWSSGPWRNDVWYSTDAVNWTQATANAGWSGRESHTSVVFDNRIWVIGGYNSGSYFNDVWYSETGTPQIWVNPTSFNVTLSPGGSATDTLTIGNSGTANLNWSLAEDPSVAWLSENPLSGAVSPGSSQDVTLTFYAPTSPGIYNTDLVISSNDPGSPTNVPVQLTVSTLPEPANLPCRTCGTDSSEHALALAQSSDFGYVLAGWTTAFAAAPNDTNALIVKTDSLGVPTTARVSVGFAADQAYSMVRTTDNGYAITGWTKSYGAGGSDIFVLRLDANLNLLWGRVYGGLGDDQAYSIIQDSDGSYVLTGWTSSFGEAPFPNIIVVKLTPGGGVQWARAYNLADPVQQHLDEGRGIIDLRAAGRTIGYAVVGRVYCSTFYDNWDGFLMYLDPDGNFLGVQVLYGRRDDEAHSVAWDQYSSRIVVAGWTENYGPGTPGPANIFVAKFPSTPGAPSWSRVYGWGDEERVMDDRSLIITNDRNYAVSGWTGSVGPAVPSPNFLIMKLGRSDGSVIWSRVHPSMPDTNRADEAYPMIQTANGGYAIAGWTNSLSVGKDDFHFLTLDQNGNRPVCTLDTIPDTAVCPWTANLMETWEAYPDTTHMPLVDAMVQSVDICRYSTAGVRQLDFNVPSAFALRQNYPNPCNPSTVIGFDIMERSHVEVAVYDVLGRQVARLLDRELPPGSYQTRFDGSNLPSGIYFYRLRTETFTAVKKMVLAR